MSAKEKPDIHRFHLHLVSDATGGTLHGLARACIAQFEGAIPIEKFWNLVRTQRHLDIVIEGIEENPGPVLFTLVDPKLRRVLRDRCHDLKLPCIPVLDPIMKGMGAYLGIKSKGEPGLQHQLDDVYFDRIQAMDFAQRHDDGQNLEGLEEADVILVGVSRTSKTPTSMYLANRGIKVGNYPLVPGVAFPEELKDMKGPLFVGLTESPDRLVEIRKTRLKADDIQKFNDNLYLAHEEIQEEIRQARRLFSSMGWPVIDVTRRSIEETAAEVLTLLAKRKPQIL